MRNISKTKATIVMLLGLSLAAVIPSPAIAATTDATPSPTITQQQAQAAVDAFNVKVFASQPAAQRKTAAGVTTNGASINAVSSRRASIRWGYNIHYHDLNVDFYYNWSRVTSSYAWQNGMSIGLNTMKLTGVQKSYDDGWTHKHHASALRGVGVPTPWGGINIVEVSTDLFSRVHGDGAWAAWS